MNSTHYIIPSLFWKSHSKLFIKGDHANWSLHWDAIELTAICRNLGIDVIPSRNRRLMKNQCFFNMSRFEFLEKWQKPNCRIAFPYYHGNPSHDEGSRKMLATIQQHHEEIERIQVSCRFMEEVIIDTGIDPAKIFLIHIGVNRRYFTPANPERKAVVRKKLGIPQNAFLIGSFQKDGNGWGEGLEPKLVKGPDIFLQTLEILKADIPDIHVLLTGPARGYVIAGLERLSIPYTHHLLDDYTDIGQYYHALDAYIISSRDEGGPKAVLESMASGVPLISTKVGQATDLIEHGKNGFLANIEDAEALAHWTAKILKDNALRESIIRKGLITAAGNDYDSQLELWRDFMMGFVEV